MMRRITIMWRERRLKSYLNGIEKRDKKGFDKLNSKIMKLEEHGDGAINHKTIKTMKGYKISDKVIRIKLNNRRKPYRLYALLTPQNLYLLEGRDKKRNDMSRDLKKYIMKIIKEIISDH